MDDASGSGTGGASGAVEIYASVTITPDPGFKLTLEGMTATEELGRPFLFELQMASTTAKGELMSLLGSNMRVQISLPNNEWRYFNGIIARVAYAGLSRGAFAYRIELRPWIWLLSRKQDCKIFQNKSPWDIINDVVKAAEFTLTDKRANGNGNTVLEYCVQYRETTLDFITRLMEEYGLYYFFTHTEDGEHHLNVADDPNSHASIGAAIPFQIRETDYRAIEDHIWQWSSDLMVQPGTTTLQDYNFTTSTVGLLSKSVQPASHTHGNLEVYDFPGHYDTTSDGQTLAGIRMQGLAARRQVMFGATNSRRIYAGGKFTLKEFYESAENTEYLITRATCTISGGEGSTTSDVAMHDSFGCGFQSIKATTPFRLERLTPKPMIRGPQTAKVVGQSGDEVTTDQYGRIKVQFPWDRDGKSDQNSSCWIRVVQSWAGKGWGSMFIPRVGQEVVVEFLEGNPDRPIVTGCVYNDVQTVPYSLPDNKTRSVFKTSSSTGNSGSNEFRFEDKAGSEEVFFQAQKDYNKTVLNNEVVKVTQDTTTTVEKGNRSATVSKGNDSLTVSSGNHSVDVSAGKSEITAAQSITLTVGGNSIKIDTEGVTITATKITLKAQAELEATAGASMSLKPGATLTIEAGATATIKSGAPMTIQAPMVNIN